MPRRVTALAGVRFPPGKAAPRSFLERGVHYAGEIAGIIDLAGRGLERHRGGRNEVLAPELGPILADLARGGIHQPLHQIDGFRPAGATVGIHRRGVGEGALHPVDEMFDIVHPGQDLERGARRDERPEQRAVGAKVGRCLHLHAEYSVIGIQGELRLGDVIAAHHVRQKVSLRSPVHFTGRPSNRDAQAAMAYSG